MKNWLKNKKVDSLLSKILVAWLALIFITAYFGSGDLFMYVAFPIFLIGIPIIFAQMVYKFIPTVIELFKENSLGTALIILILYTGAIAWVGFFLIGILDWFLRKFFDFDIKNLMF